ncbi:hypothetical protein E2C01_058528 [Portunus trituberculatus]|uniref:Uncharacterized protein n=1 Tax=Portunus trituberculatus TaxID=210409 RepID=A0A5B7H021_PORTR|nr:hypothetical protein [Portunus trituberculatus]
MRERLGCPQTDPGADTSCLREARPAINSLLLVCSTFKASVVQGRSRWTDNSHMQLVHARVGRRVERRAPLTWDLLGLALVRRK